MGALRRVPLPTSTALVAQLGARRNRHAVPPVRQRQRSETAQKSRYELLVSTRHNTLQSPRQRPSEIPSACSESEKAANEKFLICSQWRWLPGAAV